MMRHRARAIHPERPSIRRRTSSRPFCSGGKSSRLDRARSLAALHERIRRCTKCRLCESRTHAVPGEGRAPARVMIVGEAPGAREDAEGRPFVGRAGRFLDEMLIRAGLSRDRVFITNSVKCRPPENRRPYDDELAICGQRWLVRQIDLVDPRIIVLLGAQPLRQMFGGGVQLAAIHGQAREDGGRIYFATYHPAAAMRFPAIRRAVSHDIGNLKRLVERQRAA